MSFKPGRAALTACLTAGLVVAVPAAAHAGAEYSRSWTKADAGGSRLHIRQAYVDEDGAVVFRDSYYSAGPNGASVRHVYSRAH
ncbi:hypothetical protein [Actinomadura kijaniata]|uniref:hypothetical protein n=1 Tax=Actinomadura kijaniata TaxID=46161 RepID=UPI000830CCD0|nr:hypothetical protein [Actinomadura kijaniata]